MLGIIPALKLFSTAILILTMIVFAPTMLLERHTSAITPTNEGLSIQVATDSVRITELEAEVKVLQEERIGEQLAELRMEQKGVLALLAPIALFIFTTTWENIQRMRGKARTRQTDK